MNVSQNEDDEEFDRENGNTIKNTNIKNKNQNETQEERNQRRQAFLEKQKQERKLQQELELKRQRRSFFQSLPPLTSAIDSKFATPIYFHVFRFLPAHELINVRAVSKSWDAIFRECLGIGPILRTLLPPPDMWKLRLTDVEIHLLQIGSKTVSDFDRVARFRMAEKIAWNFGKKLLLNLIRGFSRSDVLCVLL